LGLLPALAQSAEPAPRVRFAILRTATLPVHQGLVMSGGSFGQQVATHFSAFLIEHSEHRFLFDAGLGRRIRQQYEADMPGWNRPFFRLPDSVQPAADQLQAAGLPPVTRILLSHAHWDHASALEDFPGAEVWLAAPEQDVVRQAASRVATAWPSQVRDKPVTWQPITFDPVPHEGFEASLDLYRDGRVVLVPMFGHTPGSIGVFLRVASGRRFFFVGDVVWNAAALAEGRPKFWLARWFVDQDAGQTQAVIGRIRAAMARDPALVVVPAHDGAVQDGLGLFPRWVE
jgi:glyoxylase-like metal-dependent hydrolase (beta-lactamase superfamily II)